ncbi:hypothetical protein BV509_16740 [Rhodovulum sulfidophilum]|uniref:Uncharacterized protein n=1 Tax=Rhodovulum visakhapatnamense TaxID=364297 RepID=A0ABS1RCN9_9RHOB|nr:hypothetical protein [Rhodovulum visakhapatnamense]MBL3569293.1 hypothetical protein [Rhodovulum visakhapatnamense]MBL3577264.1 hypothetical protein [Rhodovulum visakhapatnamense]OLS45834.1 hypothetical protein BV509_16740 [Rhodovulum sulfidophilum]
MNVQGHNAVAQSIANYTRASGTAGVRSSDFAKAAEEASGPAAASPADAPRGPDAIADIFARYDMANISPREIDAMARDLRDAGFEDHDFLLHLEIHGETFQSHLVDCLREAGMDVRDPDFTQPMDMFSTTRAQISYSRLAGQPTAWLESFLAKLETYQSPVHADAARGAVAQSMVLGQAR